MPLGCKIKEPRYVDVVLDVIVQGKTGKRLGYRDRPPKRTKKPTLKEFQ